MHRDSFDPKRLLGSVLLVDLDSLNLGQSRQTVITNDLAKHGVQAIQMRRAVEKKEELRAVGSRTLVRHRDEAPATMAEGRPDLVVKDASPDRSPTLGVVWRRLGRAAGLGHEVGDHAVEGRLVVVARRAEGEEILERLVWILGKGKGEAYFCGLGDALAEDFDLEVPERGMQCDGHGRGEVGGQGRLQGRRLTLKDECGELQAS